MIINYDLHIHSALSPCADDNMTPVNICGFAKLKGLDIIAIADHNSIGNVEVAIRAGKEFGITVVPAVEIQTQEDIHILCLFENIKDLNAFYDSITFTKLKNRADIFGNQLIYNENNEVTATEERMLLTACDIKVSDISHIVKSYGGAAVPAHIDREANSILSILGAVTEEFLTVELSKCADKDFVQKYSASHRTITSSDAHTLEDIGGGVIELKAANAKTMIDFINYKIN